MNKRIIVAVTLGLLLATPVLAANNDVVLNSGTEISIDSVTLTVSGSQASAVTVNANDFEVTMPTGSTIVANAASLRRITHSTTANTLTVTNDCTADRSVLTLTNNDAGSVTVTIAIASDTCGTSSTGGGGGGGGIIGGGGGGGYIPAVTPTNPATTTTNSLLVATSLIALTGQTPTPVSIQTSSAVTSFTFTRSLYLGLSGADVKELQRVLALDPTLYPEANLSGYFGRLTQKAVQRFQERHSIASVGSQGYGVFGPTTRAKFVSVYGSTSLTTSGSAVISSGSITVMLKRGMTHAQVKILQQILNKDPETAVASEGVGSAGMETDYFGSLTEKAVMKFQAKYGIEAIGLVGPMTRAKLNSI